MTPSNLRLRGAGAEQQLLVSVRPTGDDRAADRTAAARFTSLSPAVARVSAGGLVTAVRDGAARIRVQLDGAVTEVPVSVQGTREPHRYSFVNDIEPVLTRAGCNSGACHGKAEGQGTLRLSLFGYDPEADYAALFRGAAGRRLRRTDPGASLMLLKPTAKVPHGGGARFREGSREYRRLADWIASGAPYGAADKPALTALSVYPEDRTLGRDAAQRVLVTARYSDGATRDVTREARFASNNEAIASVDASGRARTHRVAGGAAIMVLYGGKVGVSRLLVPRPGPPIVHPTPPAAGEIDRLVWARLRKLRIRPSEPASDAEFLRRVYLDVIGTLPTPDEAREFLAECAAERKTDHGDTETRSPNRGGTGSGKTGKPDVSHHSPFTTHPSRPKAGYPLGGPTPNAYKRLVDRLLDRPEYADYWALQWADILRVNKDRLGAKGAYDFYRWIRDSVAGNVPYDGFIRELVTAAGRSSEVGAANYYRVLGTPQEQAAGISQTLLGVRIECAQCHHHPFEKWSQDDYYGMVGFFTRLKSKPAGAQGIYLVPGGDAEAVNPRTGKTVPPHPLDGAATGPGGAEAGADRRERLAEWMTRPDNRFVPRMIANRLWARFLGRGLVEPVDDFRDTNPPSNPELLDTLARRVVESRYDLKEVIRAITTSRVYQLSAQSNPTNAGDEQNYSRAYPKRLTAEVLMDSVAQTTGAPPELPGLPPGTRAIQVWDSDFSSQWQSYFLNAFGRPPRTSPCECERSQEPSVAQALHMMNAPEIQRQISARGGRARRLAESELPPARIVEELFLATYGRRPTAREAAASAQVFARAGGDRVGAAEDVLWALMNTMEFVFNH